MKKVLKSQIQKEKGLKQVGKRKSLQNQNAWKMFGSETKMNAEFKA